MGVYPAMDLGKPSGVIKRRHFKGEIHRTKSNMAMAKPSFVDDAPIETSIYR
jgi:hypothetical protein